MNGLKSDGEKVEEQILGGTHQPCVPPTGCAPVIAQLDVKRIPPRPRAANTHQITANQKLKTDGKAGGEDKWRQTSGGPSRAGRFSLIH